MKIVGIVEIALGLLLVAGSSYMLAESALFPQTDRHGFGLALGLFGASLGGLLAFAGVALTSRSRWWLAAHVPLLAYSVVVYLTWSRAYA
jgi:hypothetical protein